MKTTKQKIRITDRDQKFLAEIDAQVYGDFAIHKDYKTNTNGYTVTHIASGGTLIRNLKYYDSRWYLRAIQDQPERPLKLSNGKYKMTMEVYQAHKKILENYEFKR